MSSSIFTYNASALGLGGVLKQGDATSIVPSLASVALAPTGGEGFSDVSNYSKDGISFSRAASRIIGYESGSRLFTTNTDIYITNLNLFGRVTAAVLQTSITSTRSIETDDVDLEGDPDKTEFQLRAMIRGLAVDGDEIIPQFDFELSDCPNYGQFKAKVEANRGEYIPRFGWNDEDLTKTMAKPGVPIRASILKDVLPHQCLSVGSREGYTLPIQQFGRVHLGELIVKPGRRRVNLLRIDFNNGLQLTQPMGVAFFAGSGGGGSTGSSTSPDSGSMTIMSGDSNGVPIWPT